MAQVPFVHDFSTGSMDMKDLLGGKGANLAEMTRLGIPVPPGFTITTQACRAVLELGSVPAELFEEVDEHLARLEATMGRRLGNAADPAVLAAAGLGRARRLFVAIPQSFEAGQVCEQARRDNPALPIIARAHSDAEVAHLTKCGATLTIMGEAEIARAMLALCAAQEPPPAAEPQPA